MKRFTLVTCIVFLFSLIPAHLFAADDPVIKTFCTSAFGYQNLDDIKANLLTNAKRDAVNELFGELIAASTTVENFVVTGDQIRASSIGFVRIEGNVSFYNGDNLAEVCVTIRAYATAEDRKQFQPVKLDKRHCVTDAKLTTSDLTAFARQEVIVQALLDYDRKLDGKDRTQLLQLLQRVDYVESGFVPETETYCVRVTGEVVPIEVIAFLDARMAGTQAEGGTSTLATADTKQIQTGSTQFNQLDSAEKAECLPVIEFGQTVECSLESSGHKIAHEFSGDIGDFVLVTVVRVDGTFEPAFQIRDETGRVAFDGQPCQAASAKIAEDICELRGAGTYSIVVYSNAPDKVGQYSLRLQRLNNPAEATTLEFGQVVQGSIDTVARYHYYTFTGDVGDLVLVTLVRSDGILEPAFRIRDETGKVAFDGQPCQAASTKIAEDGCELRRAGTFSIIVYSNAPDKTGMYSLRLQRLNIPAGAPALEFGQTVNGSIETVAEYKYYTFTGDVDDLVVVTVARVEGTLEPAFRIRDETGKVAFDGQPCQAAGTRTAEDGCRLRGAGIYSIHVYSNDATKTGQYTLTLNKN